MRMVKMRYVPCKPRCAHAIPTLFSRIERLGGIPLAVRRTRDQWMEDPPVQFINRLQRLTLVCPTSAELFPEGIWH